MDLRKANDLTVLRKVEYLASIATPLTRIGEEVAAEMTQDQWFGIFEPKDSEIRAACQRGWERLWDSGYCRDSDRSMIKWA